MTCAMLREHIAAIRAELAAVGLELPKDAYVFAQLTARSVAKGG